MEMVLPAYARSAVAVADGIAIVYVAVVPGLRATDWLPSEYDRPESVAESLTVPRQVAVPAAQRRPNETVRAVAVTVPFTVAAGGVVTGAVTVTVAVSVTAFVPSLTVKAKVSPPLYPAVGAYVNVDPTWVSVPCSGAVLMLKASASPS